MRIFLIILLSVFSSPSLAESVHPDLSPFSKVLNAEIYAGFGLARDMVSHVYRDAPFQPRDYDLAIVGSNLSEDQATEVLSKYGTIVKTLQMYREEIKPNGNVFAYHYGFVIIIDAQGTQIDFKFFNTVEEAHTRGLFDVEKILIPFKGRSVEEVVADLVDYKTEAKPFEISDPHDGFSSVLSRNPKTVNWAKAKASSLDWIIRGAMINAKLGDSGFNPTEKELMKKQLRSIQYIRESELALIRRAIAHKKSWRVRELLTDVGFFKYLKKWRWNDQAIELVKSWKPRPKIMACGQIFL